MTEQAKESYMKEAVSLVTKTLPLMALNAAVYIGFFVVALVWFSLWTGLAIALGAYVNEIVGLFCFLIALGATGWMWRIARRYILYLVKGAHIAAMTEIMCGRDVPTGPAQIQYGRKIVTKYFRDVSVLFGLDMIIKAIVRGLTGTVVRFMNFLPLPGSAKNLVQVIRQIINRSLSYMDAAILSYSIQQREENVWKSARHGILLYAQSYKGILITSGKLWVIAKVINLLVFGVLVIPFVGLSAFLDTGMGGLVFFVGLIMAAIGGRLIELAFFEPFALAYIMVTYQRETAGVEPNAEWDQKLQKTSKKFRELVTKSDNFEPSSDFHDDADALPAGQPVPTGQTPNRQSKDTEQGW